MEKIHKNILIVDEDEGFSENIKHTLLSALRNDPSDARYEFYMRHVDDIDEAVECFKETTHQRTYDLIVIDGLVVDKDEEPLSTQGGQTEEEILERDEIQKIGYSYHAFISTIQKTQKKDIPIVVITTSPKSASLPGTHHSFVKGYGKGMFPGHKNEHAQLIRDLVLK